MVKMSQRLASDTIIHKQTYGGGNKKTHITIHETGNLKATATAEMHARLQASGNSRTASWHWQVDDKEAIQSFLHNISCWHGGDGGKGTGNLHSIAIEICINDGGDYKKAVQNAAELTRHIMRMENIPIQNVVQHNKWSGKDCPHYLRSGKKGINWTDFINTVRMTSNVAMDEPAPAKKEDDDLIFSSPTLKTETETSLLSRAHRQIIVDAAVKAGAHPSWLDKLENKTITDADVLGLAVKYTVAVNK